MMKASNSNPMGMACAVLQLFLFPHAALADGCPAPSFAPAVNYETGSGCCSAW